MSRDSVVQTTIQAFRDRFGCDPGVIVRAPGRVNLIGEHTDYNGLPVLPFAIAQSHCLAAARGGGPLIELANTDSRYCPKAIAVDDLAEFSRAGEWDNYPRAALLGLMDAQLLARDRLARGLRILVSSDLPSGVGLSSSSALVVGFALVALEVCAVAYDRLTLAEVLAEAEHYVGTRGGGMDQAVCLLGREGHAARIDFFPLRAEQIRFGGDVEVFLTDSGVRVEKSGAGRALYNRRPVECRLALAVFRAWAKARGRADLATVRYWGDLVKPPLSLSHEVVLRMIDEGLEQTCYSTADVCRRLGIGENILRESYLTTGPGQFMAQPADGFRLRQRAQHVVGEARRVEQAVEALRRSDWRRLAELVKASHASCRDLYEISCPELERLVEAAEEAGALGSRLTGAGFGGCALHLVRRGDADRFVRSMSGQLAGSQGLLKVTPSAGAEVEWRQMQVK